MGINLGSMIGNMKSNVSNNEVNALNSQVDILKNEQVINEQNSSNTENEGN